MLSTAAFRAKGLVHRALQHQQWAGCQERLSTCSAAGWTKGFSEALARSGVGGVCEASNQRGMEGHNSFPNSVALSFWAYTVNNFVFKLDVFNTNIATDINKIFLFKKKKKEPKLDQDLIPSLQKLRRDRRICLTIPQGYNQQNLQCGKFQGPTT